MNSKEQKAADENYIIHDVIKQHDVIEVDDNSLQSNAVVGSKDELLYKVNDTPPWYLTIFFALQQVSISVTGSVTVPLIVSELICAGHLPQVRASIASTFLFMCGVSTLLQVTIGSRLPIIQGGCNKFIPPIVALMTIDRLRCPEADLTGTLLGGNLTENVLDHHWRIPMREIQGGIIMGSLVELLLGATGAVGAMIPYLGPITIMPTITLVGISLFDLGVKLCSPSWPLSLTTMGLILILSLYMGNINFPCFSFSKKKGCRVQGFKLFRLLPIILAVAVAWMISGIMTVCGRFPSSPSEPGYKARADAYVEAMYTSPWIYVPYPGQWGTPTFSIACFLGMLAATMTSIIESLGDYYACARISQLPPPPVHAINRGITMEGLAGMLSGLLGTGGSTTSYSQNIGAIGFTSAASRAIFVGAGLIFLLGGVLGKFGALLTMMPDPILGGVLVIGLGMVSAVGISNLQFVDVNSTRNQVIIGFSLMMGMIVPSWVKDNPDAINTGILQVDQSMKVLFGTSMFVGGFLAFLLDNTVPGSPESRGITAWQEDCIAVEEKEEKLEKVEAFDNVSGPLPLDPVLQNAQRTKTSAYDMPFVQNWFQRHRWTHYIPISPSYKQGKLNICGCLRKRFSKK